MFWRRFIIAVTAAVTVVLLMGYSGIIFAARARNISQDIEWTPNTESGVPLWIGMNSLVNDLPTPARHIFIFIEPQNFTVGNIRKIFLYFSQKYTQPEYLLVSVRSDKAILQKWIDHYRSFYALPIDSVGRQIFLSLEKEMDDLEKKMYEMTKTGCYRAEFSRSDAREGFTYSPDPNSEKTVLIDIRWNPSFVPKGDTPRERYLAMATPWSLPYVSTGDTSFDLVYMAREGFEEQVKKLLNEGADPNKRNKYGVTPLVAASLRGWLDIAVVLLNKGADVNLKTSEGWSPLMCAIRSDRLAEELMRRGADVNARNDAGQTVLTLAAAGSSDEIIVELLKRGADINSRDKHGRTPLMIAEEHYRVTVANLLKEAMTKK